VAKFVRALLVILVFVAFVMLLCQTAKGCPVSCPARKTERFFWLVMVLRKNMKVNGKKYPIYYGKIKIFGTANQFWSPSQFFTT
jgi:hypothetical protein